MEPLTTTAMIGAVVGYLAKKLKDNKSLQDFFGDFTDATVQWVRPLFLKADNEYEKIITDLIKNPDSNVKRQMVENTIASHLEDTPDDEAKLKAMYEELLVKAKKESAKAVTITGDSNKAYHGIHDSTVIDNFVVQTNSGSGDNVFGDKKIYNIDKIDKSDFH